MKSRKPLKRSPLKRATREQVTFWWSRPRKPLPKIGAKKQRERYAEAGCRAIVSRRGYCESAGNGCSPLSHPGAHCHHVFPEDRDRGLHDPDRCLFVCFLGHTWIHSHPADAARAGLLRPDRACD